MATCAFAAVGTLQSCKDELSDFEHQYAYDQHNLSQVIEALRASCDAAKADCDAKIADLQAQITSNDVDIAKLQDDLNALAGEVANRVTIEQLNTALSNLENNCKSYTDAQVAAAIGEVKTYVDQLIKSLKDTLKEEFEIGNARITAIENDLTTVKNQVNANTAAINQLSTDVAAANAQIELNKAAIAAINAELDGLKTTLKNHERLISDLQEKYAALDAKIDAVKEELMNEINDLQQQINDNRALIDELSERLDVVEEKLAEIEEELDALTNRVNDLLTGILVQGVDNPVFGNFSLPLGVRSNLAFDWYGQFDNDVVFPSALTENTYDAEPCVLTSADLAFLRNSLALSTESYSAGYQTNGSLGTVYMTLNPFGHNLTEGKIFTLETSAGRALPFELNVVKSDTELSFGYTRANNGFYETEVLMPATAEAINACKFEIEPSLKDAAKDILDNVSKRNALNLLKAVYDQFDGALPAYAVRADWTAADAEGVEKPYAVVSGYDLAVTTAKPLSYKFLYGKGTDHKIPTYGHISNFIGKLKEKFDAQFNVSANIEIDGKVVKYTTIEFYECDDPAHSCVDFEVVGLTVDGVSVAANGCITDIDNAVNVINQAIGDAVAKEIYGASCPNSKKAEVYAAVNVTLLEVSKQINGVINDVKGNIDSIFDEAENSTESYFEKVNKVIDVYNKVAGKINNFLKNPNNYLQVAAFYKTNSGVGMLSNVKNDPTVFSGAGSAFTLYLSSYTAETVCPAYKKFAAVVNVYDEAGNSVRNAELQNIARINSNSTGLNKVLDGRSFRISVPVSDMKAGYTYELVYQGLDYSGVTSTQKFYIKVK